jgi:hypothetical protein
VAVAFQRAVQEVVRLKPDLVFLVGDIFDRPDPTPGALVSLAQGLESFRTFLPSTPVFIVAGARDTPRRLGDPGALAALDPFPHVETATSTARSLYLREMETHVLLVPYRSVVRRPYPKLSIRPEAKWNVLVAYAGVGGGPGEGLLLDPGPWDYVALGFAHQQQEVAPRVFYSGSLERVGPEPWRDAVQEKGFLTFDLKTGTSRFHPIRGRPVVALAPIRIPGGESRRLTGRVQEVLREVPGGIEGKIVRLRVEGLSPEEVRREDEGLFAPLRERALHLAIEVDDFQKVAEDNRLPLVSRDRGFAYRVLRDRLRGEQDGEEAVALMVDLVPVPSTSGDRAGLEEELLIREVRGSGLPRLAELSFEAREGLLAWVGGDGRILRAFLGVLLWGAGITDSPGEAASVATPDSEPSLAMKLGVHGGSFWLHSGASVPTHPGEEVRSPEGGWGLSPEDVGLVWCGAGEETPDGYLESGARVLASARGGEVLELLMEELRSRYSGLPEEAPPEELSPEDFERLRIEAELEDLRAQLLALQEVPDRVLELETELRDLRASGAEVAGDLEGGTMDWHRERQDAETHLQAYRDQARELQARIRKLEALGPDTPCPTCGRHLEAESEKVLLELREEWEILVQDGKWWRRRWEQLETKPPDLQEMEVRSVRLNASVEDATERLERARFALREMDELRVREREMRIRLEAVLSGAEDDSQGTSSLSHPEGSRGVGGRRGLPPAPPEAVRLMSSAHAVHSDLISECRTRLLHRGGRRLNRLTGGRILGLHLGDSPEGLQLVDPGGSAGVEADEDHAAAVVALRMALMELLAEDWSPFGSFVLGDPFDRMGEEDQLRALGLLRRVLSRIPQVLLLTRGEVVERAPELFDGLYEYREEPEKGVPPLRALPSGVGILRLP